MKLNYKIIVTCAALFVSGLVASAQTNISTTTTSLGTTVTTNALLMPDVVPPSISGGLKQIASAALDSTNFAIAVGGGRCTKGDLNLLFADYLYNFVGSGSTKAGFLLGFDEIASGTHFTTKNVNFVKGGFNVSTDVKYLGLTFTPYGSILIDTANGLVGQIVVVGANYRLGVWKWGTINITGFYENRTGGDTATDGAYICGALAYSKGF